MESNILDIGISFFSFFSPIIIIIICVVRIVVVVVIVVAVVLIIVVVVAVVALLLVAVEHGVAKLDKVTHIGNEAATSPLAAVVHVRSVLQLMFLISNIISKKQYEI